MKTAIQKAFAIAALAVAAFSACIVAAGILRMKGSWSESFLSLHIIASVISIFLICCSFRAQANKSMNNLTLLILLATSIAFVIFSRDAAAF